MFTVALITIDKLISLCLTVLWLAGSTVNTEVWGANPHLGKIMTFQDFCCAGANELSNFDYKSSIDCMVFMGITDVDGKERTGLLPLCVETDQEKIYNIRQNLFSHLFTSSWNLINKKPSKP